MKETSLKQSVLEAARSRLRGTIEELRERINDLHAVTIGDDNSESASQTESTHGSDVELMNSLSEQLDHLQKELDRLSAIDPTEKLDTVHYGSIVVTDKRNFLIAASVEEFQVEGRSFLGVTPKAPLIQKMLGKKVGEQLEFNGVSYTIKKIF